jgi:hypothetical protein
MSTETPPLHPSIVALVALSANIAANHPKQGLCQVDKLRGMGVPQAHIDAVVEIARHIRDEAGLQLDTAFDERLNAPAEVAPPAVEKPRIGKGVLLPIAVQEACCTPTKSGQSCC